MGPKPEPLEEYLSAEPPKKPAPLEEYLSAKLRRRPEPLEKYLSGTCPKNPNRLRNFFWAEPPKDLNRLTWPRGPFGVTLIGVLQNQFDNHLYYSYKFDNRMRAPLREIGKRSKQCHAKYVLTV